MITISCWAAALPAPDPCRQITEAWHLVSESARIPVIRFTATACDVCEFGAVVQARILTTLERFADLSMDYADATLVVLAELQRVSAIATIDVNDFTAYRLSTGRAFRLVF